MMRIQRAMLSISNNPTITPPKLNNVVLIDGVRTPFCKSFTNYRGWKPHQLGSCVIKGLLEKTGLNKDYVDYVCMGSVVQEITTSNIARDSMLVAGIPDNVPAHTVTMACLSASQAITTGMNMIKLGQTDVVIAGGVDTLSDPPIKISEELRTTMMKLKTAKTIKDYFTILAELKFNKMGIELPSMTEYVSGETMGNSADRLCSSFEITRQQQDEYAFNSYQLAEKAKQTHHLSDIIPVMTEKGIITDDNTIRNITLERLNSMRPFFIKDYGTVTVGNASPLTDGAAVLLIMSEEKAKQLNLEPKAYIRDFIYTAQDPIDQLLIGPAYAIPRLMLRNKLNWDDISVVELHEAFAGQVLSVISALESDYFCKKHIGLDTIFGKIPLDKLNKWGGSISLGHPFGATGSRLVTMAANRLIYEHTLNPETSPYALISVCSAGGLGHAMIIERYR